jgi:SAM-dependent methyltransferase
MAVIAPQESSHVVTGYARLAPFYDQFTAGYDYDTWTEALETLARAHGLRGRRLLDLACGTGKSFVPFLSRDYAVTACDISPEMVAAAAAKPETRGARLLIADMRELPDLGRFDLITCLDDSLNYLLEDSELIAALAGMRRSLAEHGLVVFDCNSATTYRTAFRSEFVREQDGLFFAWRGGGSADGGLASATIDIFARGEDGWDRHRSDHVQRHFTREAIERGLAAAGLELVAVRGQSPGGHLDTAADEGRHTKLVYLARRAQIQNNDLRGGACA